MELAGDEKVGKRVCSGREDSQINDEVVGWPCRWCKENDKCYDPVDE